MATSIFPLLVVFLLAATASARPCKTLFYFSAAATTTTTTTTTTYYPFNSHHRNPNPNSLLHTHYPFNSHHHGNPNPNSLLHTQNPRYLTLIFTTPSRFPIRLPSLNFDHSKPSDEDSRSSSSMMTPSDFPLKSYSTVSSSIRDRSRDIMTVAAALAAMLLGAGCGALTAAVVYFVYVLFSRRRRDVDSDDVDSDDDVTVAKKFGYVAIPAMPKLADDDLKKPWPPAKEMV